MSRYLTDNDYITIQNNQLNQIVQGNYDRLYAAERAAQEEISSYLVQRFDISNEFTNTGTWDKTITYNPGDRIYLDAPLFSTANSYGTNDLVTFNNLIYSANLNIIPGIFNTSQWTLLGKKYDLFYGKFPFTQFNINNYYTKGDQVFWKGFIWTAVTNTTTISGEDAIQYVYYSNIPLSNVFPDSLANSDNQFWANKTAYNIPAGTLPTDSTKWVKGDNRGQQTMLYLIDLSIYHLHSSIAPMNIPELRVKRYDDACKWLRRVSLGEITANFPLKQPSQGLKRKYGGKVRNQNTW